MTIWGKLSKAELQDALGVELLSRIEEVLPVLPVDDDLPGGLYATPTLAKLFEAFAAPSLLQDRDFRVRLLESCTTNKLDALIARLSGPDSLSGHSEKVAWLARKPWKAEGLAGAFVAELELPESLLPFGSLRKPSAERVLPSPQPLKRLKDYQADVFYRTDEVLEPPHGRVVLQMPTGSGKTRTAMEVVSSFLQGDESARVIWLAHSSELCDQAADAFLEVWSHYADRDVGLYRCWGRNKGVPPPGRGQVWMWVVSFQSAFSLLKKGGLPKADLIVLDEAHKVLAPTYLAAVNGMMDAGTRVMGLTATPGRGADLTEANEALADFFFNRKVTLDSRGEEDAISFLRRRGVLARLDREILRTGVTVDVAGKRTQREMGQGADVPQAVLDALARNDLRSAEIAVRLANLANEGKSALHFATSVEHSVFVTALLSFMGVAAAHVDGDTPARQREAIISAFRDKRISVLSNFGVLTTGFDAPKVDVLCISRPTASVVLYSQMLGRGLRGPAIGGTPRCLLIDVVDNLLGLPEVEQIYSYFDEYYESE